MPARDWREGDRGGRHGAAPSSVRGVVQRIQRALSAACMAEGALLFVAAWSLTSALIVRAGGALWTPAAWALGLLAGGCSAACWMREHHQGAAQIARSLDLRMRHQGALVTAYELEARSESSALGGLLVRRVLERLRLREALRAMFPSLVVPIATPLLGLGLLGLSLDIQRDEASRAADIGALTEGMLGALSGLDQASLAAADAEAIQGDTLRELLSLSDRAQALSRRAELLGPQPEQLLGELGSLEEDMGEMAAKLQGLPELTRPLEQAANWMDAARMELVASSRPTRPDLSPKPGSGAPGTVTPDAEKGMMSGPAAKGGAQAAGDAGPQAPQVAEPGPAASPPPSSSGSLAGDLWPSEYDGVISSWIELQRNAEPLNSR